MSGMKTVAETRRERLEELIRRHGSIAVLNEALQWPRTDPKLTQIRNANARTGRATGYQMGDAMARQIELTLGLSRGWMDNPAEAVGDKQAPLPSTGQAPLSNSALELARLFDLIPQHDLIKRAQAQAAAGQVIIDFLQAAPAAPAHKDQGTKTHKS